MFGTGAGGQTLMIENGDVLREKGPGRVAPTFIANGLVDSTSGMIAIETGAIGHNICVVTACSTGTNCVGEGAEIIRRGDVHTVIAGSAEMPLLEVAHAGLRQHARPGRAAAGRAARPTSAARSTRPATASSWARARGALILEDLEYAKARGAHIYAEVVGYGSAADGWDMIQPIEHGTGAARAMQAALDRRGVPADEVDLINPHGTSTPLGDKREAEAIWTVFGDRAARDRQSLAGQRHQVDDRPHDGRRRRVRGVRHGDDASPSSARPPTINYREFDPEADVWVCAEADARCRSATPCRTTSAWAGTTPRSSSSAGTAADRRLTPGGRLRVAGHLGTIRATRSRAPIRPPSPPQEGEAVPSADPARRAVVTGLGAVMPIGNDFETYWSNLRNAVTGTRRIQSFDATGFEVQIAAEVLDFDPSAVMDAKMVRRMSRFIHLAMGAGKEAVEVVGHRLRGDDARSSATGSASS